MPSKKRRKRQQKKHRAQRALRNTLTTEWFDSSDLIHIGAALIIARDLKFEKAEEARKHNRLDTAQTLEFHGFNYNEALLKMGHPAAIGSEYWDTDE